jgi:hypothetical protein
VTAAPECGIIACHSPLKKEDDRVNNGAEAVGYAGDASEKARCFAVKPWFVGN